MKRLLAWLHCWLWELFSGVQCTEKTSKYTLTPPLTFPPGLLWLSQSYRVNTLSSGGDVTFILSCAGDMGNFVFGFLWVSARVWLRVVSGQLGRNEALGGKYHPCAKLARIVHRPQVVNTVEVWDKLGSISTCSHTYSGICARRRVHARLLNVKGGRGLGTAHAVAVGFFFYGGSREASNFQLLIRT